ncbi:selenium cofactor biosynthesis protein YqeC [uncultured Fusobacterium sp.]|uniref:selenium cofactor biosynthesis protein YqeC n=1 Tax=uncultured Fusobacterium sp. TaxID=159267 RepID=UPI0015A5E6C5|nr:selenium cofactor biosynthesis protein YqeC [uncultured Fusobacterium sp.]
MVEEFNIEKKDIITITGVGGKTTLMFLLSGELSKLGKVMVTTTTKIYIPEKSQFEKMYISDEEITGENKNIFVFGKEIKDKKLIGIGYHEIEKLKKNFDYILIEGDGSKEKLLKEWNELEPCIPNFSNVIIGVINLDVIELDLIEENIHRFELFKEKYTDYINKKVSFDFLKEYIKNGKFFGENKTAKKYIFLNGVDGEKKSEKEKIAKGLQEIFKNEDFKIIYGSLKNYTAY